jgi:hypothetical protein
MNSLGTLTPPSGVGLNRKKNEFSVSNPLTGKMLTLEYGIKNIGPGSLANKIAKAPANTRSMTVEIAKRRDLYERLYNDNGVITNEALGYTINGGDTIYLLNGISRYFTVLGLMEDVDFQAKITGLDKTVPGLQQIFKTKIESQGLLKFPIKTFDLPSHDHWVTNVLVQQHSTESSAAFSLCEKALATSGFFIDAINETPNFSVRTVYDRLKTVLAYSPSYSAFTTLVKAGLALRSFSKSNKDFEIPNLKSKELKFLVTWLSQSTGQEIKLHIEKQPNQSSLNTNILSEIDECVDVMKEELLAVLSDQSKLNVLIENAENTDEVKKVSAPIPKSPTQNFVTSTARCSIAFDFSREDYTESDMARIQAVFEKHTAALEALKSELSEFFK